MSNTTKKQQEIISLASEGKLNSVKFEEIYDAFYWSTFNLLLHNYCNRNVQDAEEEANNAFMKLHRNINSYNPQISKFNTWFYNIVNNTGIDYTRRIAAKLRAISNNHLYIDDNSELHGPIQIQAPQQYNADAIVKAKELKHSIDTAFKTLKPIAREVMKLYLEGIKLEKISKELGIELSNVKVVIHRSKNVLTSQLKHAL